MVEMRPDGSIEGRYSVVSVGPRSEHTGHRTRRTRQRLSAAQKAKMALDARTRGRTWRQAADEAGYRSTGAAHEAVEKYLREIPAESVDEYRRVMNLRLDKALHAIWNEVELGSLPAIDRFLKIEERRSRMLGIEQSPVIEQSVDISVMLVAQRLTQMSTEEIEAELQELEWTSRDTDKAVRAGEPDDDEPASAER